MSRPTMGEVYLRLAEELSTRSTCIRKAVGVVITSPDRERIYSVGYNGNVRGFPNTCDREEAGNCGCIHAEQNALVKAPGSGTPKWAYITMSPCELCAKLMVQAGVEAVIYREHYRKPSGLLVLDQANIQHSHVPRID